jgi:5-methyltetrahydrofolate--homocysteine methyltransferase
MQHVAQEMQKDEYFRTRKTPLLIGGATTSRVHTAVKIAQHYEGPVVYVPDASRSVGVAQGLLSDHAEKFIKELNDDYERVRQQHAQKKVTPIISLAEARKNAPVMQWDGFKAKTPQFIGSRVLLKQSLTELTPFIDWAPFFQTWDLAGPYPAILQDAVVGIEAQKVFNDAQSMLKKLVQEQWLEANAVLAFYPANAVGDDVVLWRDEKRQDPLMIWHGLRQQTKKPQSRPNRCLSDFVAPMGYDDYVGCFALTTGIGVDAQEAVFLAQNDDYQAIMLKALADRLAEAYAEQLHWRVRTDLWGYGQGEQLSIEDLIAERYVGIRPAPGYPACPDHVIKKALFEQLPCSQAGLTLTSSLAMSPASSVCGFYLAHPEAQYFNVGRIGDDQVNDLANRQGVDIQDCIKFLGPNLS